MRSCLFLMRLIFCAVLLAACAAPKAESPATQPAPAARPIFKATAPAAGQLEIPTAAPQAGGGAVGEPVLTDLYVSPSGSDGASGLSQADPLRSLTAAWEKIPAGEPLSGAGYRINLLPGTYPCEPEEPDNCQNYFADRHGSEQFPIIVRALDGPGTATLRGGLNLRALSYVSLIDLTLAGGGDLPTNSSGNNLLHLADSDHILLRGVTLDGPDCANDGCNNLQEVFKVNQVQYLYVEQSDIGGAWHSSVDLFSVQHGHFLDNHLHTAGQWCMYLKGGSAYLRIEGNELESCQLGFQAGQSSNLAVMRSPWLHYEAYDIKFVNNLLHDLPGVGLSVSGGYNILFAYNTLYRVGYSTDPGYPLLQTVHGERGCNPTDELPDPAATCAELTGQGGWGPDFVTDNLPAIPNQNVYFYNNLFYNPAPAQTLYTHMDIYGPVDLPDGFVNLPARVATDGNLVLAGNLIWNGPPDHPLGPDESTGCQPGNPTCNPALVAGQNTINTVEPQLVDPANGDYRPLPDGNLYSVAVYPLPDFTWETFSPPAPQGELSNQVGNDRGGAPRTPTDPPGAYR